jgi:hypothetical protein
MYGFVNKNYAANMRICHFPLSSYFEKTPRPSFLSISLVLMFFLAATALFLTYCTKNITVKLLWDKNVQFLHRLQCCGSRIGLNADSDQNQQSRTCKILQLKAFLFFDQKCNIFKHVGASNPLRELPALQNNTFFVTFFFFYG